MEKTGEVCSVDLASGQDTTGVVVSRQSAEGLRVTFCVIDEFSRSMNRANRALRKFIRAMKRIRSASPIKPHRYKPSKHWGRA